MNQLAILLSGSAENAGTGSGSMVFSVLLPLVIVLVLFYIFTVLPQKRENQKRAEMLKTMEVGDVVVTTCGFYGVLIDITEEDVIVEFGSNKNCRIPMKKSAIAEVEKAEKKNARENLTLLWSCLPAISRGKNISPRTILRQIAAWDIILMVSAHVECVVLMSREK